MDRKAAEILHKRMSNDLNYRQRLIDAANPGGWADFQLEGEKGLNVVLFPSGDGDGEYPSYWGYDGAGGLACLVTDFGLLPCEGVSHNRDGSPDREDGSDLEADPL
jgi:hypothetical protein